MKKNYIKFLLGSALALSLNIKAQTGGCTAPFISEVVFAKDQISLSGVSPIDNSYAVELFNPSGADLDLSGYSIKLYGSSNTPVSINLSGIVASKGKFVVSFSNSDLPLTAISDLLSNDLDFQEKSRLEFWSPNGLLDRIGEVNLTQADVINIAAALADPANYLNTLNLDLSSLENITARRKATESEGDPTFTQPADKWELAQNGDISNLGLFNNVCMTAATVSFSGSTTYTITQGVTNAEPVYINVISNGGGTWLVTICGTGTGSSPASTGVHYNFQSSPNNNCYSNYNVTSYQIIDYLNVGSIPFSGTKTATLSLSSTDPQVTIDPNYGTATLKVIGGISGVEELISKYDVSISPRCIEDEAVFSINASNAIYSILNLQGQEIQKGELEFGKTNLNLAGISKGSYLLKVKTSKNEIFTLKILKI